MIAAGVLTLVVPAGSYIWSVEGEQEVVKLPGAKRRGAS